MLATALLSGHLPDEHGSGPQDLLLLALSALAAECCSSNVCCSSAVLEAAAAAGKGGGSAYSMQAGVQAGVGRTKGRVGVIKDKAGSSSSATWAMLRLAAGAAGAASACDVPVLHQLQPLPAIAWQHKATASRRFAAVIVAPGTQPSPS